MAEPATTESGEECLHCRLAETVNAFAGEGRHVCARSTLAALMEVAADIIVAAPIDKREQFTDLAADMLGEKIADAMLRKVGA